MSSTLLVIGASGLYTPGLVRLDGVHCPYTVPFTGDLLSRPSLSNSLQGRYTYTLLNSLLLNKELNNLLLSTSYLKVLQMLNR